MSNNIILDKLAVQTIYKSNSYTTNNGWLCEWATNANPNSGYISPDFFQYSTESNRHKMDKMEKIQDHFS